MCAFVCLGQTELMCSNLMTSLCLLDCLIMCTPKTFCRATLFSFLTVNLDLKHNTTTVHPDANFPPPHTHTMPKEFSETLIFPCNPSWPVVYSIILFL